jgi:hypothetical protein
MTVPRSATNRVPLQYHGNHLYFSISKPRTPRWRRAGSRSPLCQGRGRAGRHRSYSRAHQRAQPRNEHFRCARRMTASCAKQLFCEGVAVWRFDAAATRRRGGLRSVVPEGRRRGGRGRQQSRGKARGMNQNAIELKHDRDAARTDRGETETKAFVSYDMIP